ncbi:hypothetical protein AKO1_007950 [Acrasis kona]|uniref:Uncharacterized protein n=1 Tax=Acrasis kona TaxID=1008807 RepID=A0AAW2YPR1_9EUKA
MYVRRVLIETSRPYKNIDQIKRNWLNKLKRNKGNTQINNWCTMFFRHAITGSPLLSQQPDIDFNYQVVALEFKEVVRKNQTLNRMHPETVNKINERYKKRLSTVEFDLFASLMSIVAPHFRVIPESEIQAQIERENEWKDVEYPSRINEWAQSVKDSVDINSIPVPSYYYE